MPRLLAVSNFQVRRVVGLCAVIGVEGRLVVLVLVRSRLLRLGVCLRVVLVCLLVVYMWTMELPCPLGVLLSPRALPVCRMIRQ